MPDDDVQGAPDDATEGSTPEAEITSEGDEGTADDAQGDADGDEQDGGDEGESEDEGEGDEAESESEGEDAKAADDDSPEFEQLLAPYLTKGRSRKEALGLLVKSVRDTNRRMAEAAKSGTPKGDEAKDEAAEKPLDVDKHARVVEAEAQLNAWAVEFDKNAETAAAHEKKAEELDRKAERLRGRLEVAEDYEKQRLDLDIKMAEIEAREERAAKQRLESENKALRRDYHALKGKVPAIKAELKQAQEKAKQEAEDRVAAQEAFGRTWDSTLNAAFKEAGVPVDKDVRGFLERSVGKEALLRFQHGRPITDLPGFMRKELSEALGAMKRMSTTHLQHVTQQRQNVGKRVSAGPKGAAAKATGGTRPKAEAEMTWQDYQARARKAGL